MSNPALKFRVDGDCAGKLILLRFVTVGDIKSMIDVEAHLSKVVLGNKCMLGSEGAAVMIAASDSDNKETASNFIYEEILRNKWQNSRDQIVTMY